MRSIASCVAPLLIGLLSLIIPTPLAAQLGVGANGLPAEPTYLGVRLVDIDADSAGRLKLPEERGVQVIDVVDDGPADVAGIHPGDALLSYNGENILGSQQLVRLVRETPPGRKVRIQLWRDRKLQAVTVKLGSFETLAARSLSGANLAVTAIDVPSFSSPGFPDMPVMLLAWRSTLLGIECEGITSPLADYFGVKQGVLVRSVERGSPGERAGLKPGDVLVSIGDRPLSSPRDLNAFHRMYRGDSKAIPLAVVRNRRTMNVSVAPPASSPE